MTIPLNYSKKRLLQRGLEWIFCPNGCSFLEMNGQSFPENVVLIEDEMDGHSWGNWNSIRCELYTELFSDCRVDLLLDYKLMYKAVEFNFIPSFMQLIYGRMQFLTWLSGHCSKIAFLQWYSRIEILDDGHFDLLNKHRKFYNSVIENLQRVLLFKTLAIFGFQTRVHPTKY